MNADKYESDGIFRAIQGEQSKVTEDTKCSQSLMELFSYAPNNNESQEIIDEKYINEYVAAKDIVSLTHFPPMFHLFRNQVVGFY